MTQLALHFSPPNLPSCAFGNEADGGADHCPACRAESERLAALFRADVEAGKFDSEGYTPSERRAMRRKEAA